MRPYLLMDVDGPLNPHRAAEPPEGYERFHIVEGEKSWDVVLNPGHGALITSLLDTFDLVWATGWEHGANRLLAPRIGLSQEHQVIVWPEGVLASASERGVLCWKTPHLLETVGRRPFVWVDDEVTDHDRAYLDQLDGIGPHLVHWVDPAVGLTRADVEHLEAWARQLGAPG